MPELYTLASRHITGFLGVLRDRSVVYLATVQSEGAIAITHRPGSQTHLHSTAMGKALLAEMSDEAIRALLGDQPLPKLTPKTKVSMPQLLKEIEIVRRTGYATSDEENRLGFFSAGAVVRDMTGAAVAVISGAVPTATLKPKDRSLVIEQVVQASHNASSRLGAPNMRPRTSASRVPIVAAAKPLFRPL